MATSNVVDIPDQYLQTGQYVYAWVYLTPATGVGYTTYMITIPVTARPNVTNEQPTPVQQSALDEAIAALNAGVEAAESARDAIEDMDVSAGTLPAGSAATVTKSVDPETGAVTLAFGIPKGDKGDKGDTGSTGQTGPTGQDGSPGADGKDGVSPTIAVTDITGGHRVTITDADGAKVFDVMDGANGQTGQTGQTGPAGADGYSPTASVSKSGSTATITITDKNGTTTATVSDGTNGTNGQDGAPGVGVPSGGTTGQVLAKTSGTDYDAGWTTPYAGTVVETVSGSNPSITGVADHRYVCGEVSTLALTLPASGIVDVVFESGSTATVLTITPPTGVTAVKWANGFDPTSLDANTVYELNIMDGQYGVAGTWT